VPAERLPSVTLIRQFDTHRLIPSCHTPAGDSVLADVAAQDDDLPAIFELDAATNDRVLAGQQRLPGLGVEELVFGVPHAAVINAAFCHAHPLGGRFNGPDRGAWYAAFELATAQAEVGFHKAVQLAEIGRLQDSVTFDDYLADFSASFHDHRHDRARSSWLAADSYVASQGLAERLLAAHSLGVVYPSVRARRGTCVACFRPALVGNVRLHRTYRFTWDGSAQPVITSERRPRVVR
jgi:RES domain-containing protein